MNEVFVADIHKDQLIYLDDPDPIVPPRKSYKAAGTRQFGGLQLTVADEHLARLWSGVLPNLRVYSDLEVNRGGQLAWAVGSDNPKPRSSLDAFVKSHRKGTLIGNILFERYYQDRQWVSDPTSDAERNKLKKLAGLCPTPSRPAP